VKTRGRSWTATEIANVQALLAAGQTQAQVAAALGCSPSNVNKRLRALADPIGPRVYALRVAGVEFPAIASELGMEPGPVSTRRLYMRLVRYCERIDAPYPRLTPEPPRGGEPRTFDGATLFRISFFVRRRAGRGQASNIMDVAAALKLSERDVRLYTAELRRRGVLANGAVPTGRGLVEADLVRNSGKAHHAVLCAVVDAWTSGAPCETLRSLHQKLRYNRSTINVAIVRLRDEGFVAPRGNLYPRARRHE
jgi:biotin operon repressor